jgi:hypothetical protein
VYLVKGEYNAADVLDTDFKVNDMLLECVNVLVIDDTELVCTLHLSGKGGLTGPDLLLRPAWRTPAVTDDDTSIATVPIGSNVLTLGNTGAPVSGFEADDIGLTVSLADGTKLPEGTTIVQVVNATTAILSARATAAILAADVVMFLPPRSQAVTSNTTTKLTDTGGGFLEADEGRQVSGTGIEPGTIITDVTGNDATLSKPITGSPNPVIVGEPAVPNGAYTITVVNDGRVFTAATDAPAGLDVAPTQSIITSTSTFTVAEY